MGSSKGPRTVIYEPSGDNPLIGQQAMSGSVPFTLAYDHTAIEVTGSGWSPTVDISSDNNIIRIAGINNANVVQVTNSGRLMVDVSATTSLSGLIRQKLINSGSANININGSVTNYFFEYKPNAHDVELIHISFIVEEPTIAFGNTFFGETSLTNGLLLQLKVNDVVYNLDNFKYTRDMVDFSSPGGFYMDRASPDIARILYTFPPDVILKSSGSFVNPDYVRVLVRDNISGISYIHSIITGLERSV